MLISGGASSSRYPILHLPNHFRESPEPFFCFGVGLHLGGCGFIVANFPPLNCFVAYVKGI